MNLETRDQLDIHLDDARNALAKAGALLVGQMNENTAPQIDWTLFGMITVAIREVNEAYRQLPTVHSLQA